MPLLYHFAAKIISRANGQSVCAAAAYRSGEKIENDYDGSTHDYQHKENVERSIVMLPENAPEEFADRQKLWNSVEQNEKQSNAQLARELEFSLPRELPKADREQIAEEFIRENLVDKGMIADVSYHNPPKMNSRKQPVDINGKVVKDPDLFVYNNPHVHVLLPLRPVDETGKWESKRQKIYVCEKAGQQKRFTPAELRENPGWEKLYSYRNEEGEQGWYTKSYVQDHPEKKLAQVNRYPKSETIVNPVLEEWNSKEFLLKLREAWAEKVNMSYEAHEMEERVDHRSYEEQGLELIPTIHEGKAVTIVEKRLKEEYDHKIAMGEDAVLQHTDVRNVNIAIREHNQEIRIIAEIKKLREQISHIIKPVRERIETIEHSLAEKLEVLRMELINLRLKIKETVTLKSQMDEKLRFSKEYICESVPVRESRLDSLRNEKKTLLNMYKNSTGSFSRKRKEGIHERLEYVDREISILTDDLQYTKQAEMEIEGLQAASEQAEETIIGLRLKENSIETEYKKAEAEIPFDQIESVNQERIQVRNHLEKSQAINHRNFAGYKTEEKIVDRKLKSSIDNLTHTNAMGQTPRISL